MKSIDAAELAVMLDQGHVRLVDVLPDTHFAKVHIRGAENIPLAKLEGGGWQHLASDETIVVYCSGPTCPLSPRAAAFLDAHGFQNVFHFKGGLVEWIRAGHAVVRPRAAAPDS